MNKWLLRFFHSVLAASWPMTFGLAGSKVFGPDSIGELSSTVMGISIAYCLMIAFDRFHLGPRPE